MATTKMTNKTALEIALAMVQESAHPEKELVAEKLTKQIESLVKKNGKPTAKRVANMELGENLVQFLRENPTQMFSIAELMKSVPGLPEDISNQKMTSLFRQDNVRPHFRKEVVKGKAYFQFFENVEEEVEEEVEE